MKQPVKFALVSLYMLSVAAWGASSAYPIVVSEEKNPPTAAQIRGYVWEWINCFECTNGELQRVVDSGPAALADLNLVLSGDSAFFPDRTAEYEAQWDSLAAYADQTGREVSTQKPAFVNYQVGALRSVYRARAEMAIAIIDPPTPAPIP